MQYTFYSFMLFGALWFLGVSILKKNKYGILNLLGVIGVILIVGYLGWSIGAYWGSLLVRPAGSTAAIPFMGAGGALFGAVAGLVIGVLKIRSRRLAKGKKIETIAKGERVFVYPNKSDLKELTKALHKYTSRNGPFENNPIIGYHIDTKSPSFYIGLSKFDSSKSKGILEMIHTYFYKHIKFTIINLDDTSELITKLKEQGTEITLADD